MQMKMLSQSSELLDDRPLVPDYVVILSGMKSSIGISSNEFLLPASSQTSRDPKRLVFWNPRNRRDLPSNLLPRLDRRRYSILSLLLANVNSPQAGRECPLRTFRPFLVLPALSPPQSNCCLKIELAQ